MVLHGIVQVASYFYPQHLPESVNTTNFRRCLSMTGKAVAQVARWIFEDPKNTSQTAAIIEQLNNDTAQQIKLFEGNFNLTSCTSIASNVSYKPGEGRMVCNYDQYGLDAAWEYKAGIRHTFQWRHMLCERQEFRCVYKVPYDCGAGIDNNCYQPTKETGISYSVSVVENLNKIGHNCVENATYLMRELSNIVWDTNQRVAQILGRPLCSSDMNSAPVGMCFTNRNETSPLIFIPNGTCINETIPIHPTFPTPSAATDDFDYTFAITVAGIAFLSTAAVAGLAFGGIKLYQKFNPPKSTSLTNVSVETESLPTKITTPLGEDKAPLNSDDSTKLEVEKGLTHLSTTQPTELEEEHNG